LQRLPDRVGNVSAGFPAAIGLTRPHGLTVGQRICRVKATISDFPKSAYGLASAGCVPNRAVTVSSQDRKFSGILQLGLRSFRDVIFLGPTPSRQRPGAICHVMNRGDQREEMIANHNTAHALLSPIKSEG